MERRVRDAAGGGEAPEALQTVSAALADRAEPWRRPAPAADVPGKSARMRAAMLSWLFGTSVSESGSAILHPERGDRQGHEQPGCDQQRDHRPAQDAVDDGRPEA